MLIITVIYLNFNQKLTDSLTKNNWCSAWLSNQFGLKQQLLYFNMMSYSFSTAKIPRSWVATITFHVILFIWPFKSLKFFQLNHIEIADIPGPVGKNNITVKKGTWYLFVFLSLFSTC